MALTELQSLQAAKQTILDAMVAGASVVKSIEIRGRVIIHNDLSKELTEINKQITLLETRTAGNSHLKAGRTRARLGR